MGFPDKFWVRLAIGAVTPWHDLPAGLPASRSLLTTTTKYSTQAGGKRDSEGELITEYSSVPRANLMVIRPMICSYRRQSAPFASPYYTQPICYILPGFQEWKDISWSMLS
jgi:hypothetical protein